MPRTGNHLNQKGASNLNYKIFYEEVFLNEHKHVGTIVLHVLGTMLGLGWVLGTFALGAYGWALLFPIVHALPGLVGHKLFERNETVGDLRINRKDFSLIWFIRANHRMTWELFTKGYYWR
jgi:hypothetical protein